MIFIVGRFKFRFMKKAKNKKRFRKRTVNIGHMIRNVVTIDAPKGVWESFDEIRKKEGFNTRPQAFRDLMYQVIKSGRIRT